MARSRLLDSQPGTRRKIILHEEDGRQFIESRQDVGDLVKYASALRDNPEVNGKDDTALGIRVAVIPKSELDRAFNEGWAMDQDAWRKWANDPNNRAYRTTEGTI